MTSPITTEEAVLGGREGRCGESGMGNSQPLGPEDPSARNMQFSSAGKKRKRRRKRHKTEPRKEDQTTPAGGEVELCELSSDEEKTHCQWLVCDWLNSHHCNPLLNHSYLPRTSTTTTSNDNSDLRQHSPITALEWDSYPFSDGDWSPCTMYDLFLSYH